MTNEEKYIVEKFKSFKEDKRREMLRVLIEAGYSCNEIAVALNLSESKVRAIAYGDTKNSQIED